MGSDFCFVESVVDKVGLKGKRTLSANSDFRGISQNLPSKDSVEVTLKECEGRGGVLGVKRLQDLSSSEGGLLQQWSEDKQEWPLASGRQRRLLVT